MFTIQGTPRIFLLTKNSLVLADQKTGQVKSSVPLPDVSSVSVSTQIDGFFALRLKEVRTEDTVMQLWRSRGVHPRGSNKG